MIIYHENQSKSTENLLQTFKKFRMPVASNINMQKLIALICKQQTEDKMEGEFPITTSREKRKN